LDQVKPTAGTSSAHRTETCGLWSC